MSQTTPDNTMHQLILCTCPDRECAEQIARQLVEQQLAACINILPSITSVYQWQGEIETAQEHLLMIKSHRDRYAALEQKIKSIHPYDVPEIIAFMIERGSTDYLKWIDSCLAI